MDTLPEMVELSGPELDAVTGGAAAALGGLANVAVNAENIDILRNAQFDIIDDVTVTLRDIAKHNNVGVGALIQVLGGPGAIRQSQAA